MNKRNIVDELINKTFALCKIYDPKKRKYYSDIIYKKIKEEVDKYDEYQLDLDISIELDLPDPTSMPRNILLDLKLEEAV